MIDHLINLRQMDKIVRTTLLLNYSLVSVDSDLDSKVHRNPPTQLLMLCGAINGNLRLKFSMLVIFIVNDGG